MLFLMYVLKGRDMSLYECKGINRRPATLQRSGMIVSAFSLKLMPRSCMRS